MPDTIRDSADMPNQRFTAATMAGTWQTVEQAAVALGLSVRTVNRHISANKLKSRLMDGRREVFVPADSPQADDGSELSDTLTPVQPADSDSKTPSVTDQPETGPSERNSQKNADATQSFLDLDTALAMADRKADRQVELAVRAYQSLTQTIEGQAQAARKTARLAWFIVALLAVGTTSALVWTATRVTQAESDSQNLKRQADDLDKRAADNEKKLADMQDKLSAAQQQATRAETVAAYVEKQSHQPVTQPSTLPTTVPTIQNLIDRLTPQ